MLNMIFWSNPERAVEVTRATAPIPPAAPVGSPHPPQTRSGNGWLSRRGR